MSSSMLAKTDLKRTALWRDGSGPQQALARRARPQGAHCDCAACKSPYARREDGYLEDCACWDRRGKRQENEPKGAGSQLY